MKKVTFTALVQKRPKGYIGWIEEIPGANTQGATRREVMSNLKEALELVLAANKNIADNKSRFTSRHSVSVRIPA